MAGTYTISCAPGACNLGTYGGPASVLPLSSDARRVVASDRRLGEPSRAQGIKTQSYLQGETSYIRNGQCATSGGYTRMASVPHLESTAGTASVPHPEGFSFMSVVRKVVEMTKASTTQVSVKPAWPECRRRGVKRS